jgi:GT2 family glycosyltransferase
MKIGAITLSITPELVDRLTKALDQQTRPADFSVLIANSPRVRERQMRNKTWDRVVYPGFNVSFSLGNNAAEREMPDDITHLLLLNDDLVPTPTFIEEMAKMAESDAPIVGALFAHRDGTVNHAGGVELFPDAAHGDHIGRGTPASDWHGTATVPWVTFAGVLINRTLWRALGGLDESYVYGYDDHDFCLRALEIGAEIVVARDAVAMHEECGTRPRGGPRDAQNYDLFRSRWAGAPMRELLAKYKAAFPDAEGIPS